MNLLDSHSSACWGAMCMALLLSASSLAKAETLTAEHDNVPASDTRLCYDLTMEGAVGSGEFSAYHVVSQRHHVLGIRSNTGYLRAAIAGRKSWVQRPSISLSGALDVVAPLRGDRQTWLQQAYLRLDWNSFYLEAGQREHDPVLRDVQLSSGSLITSGNAKPLPEVRIGTRGFYTLPWMHEWLQVQADASYGRFLDDDWMQDRYDRYYAQYGNSWITTGVWFHQKRLYVRTNPDKILSLTLGAEHAVQFGGHQVMHVNGEELQAWSGSKPKDFLEVIIPTGGDGSMGSTNDRTQEWVKGNHLGQWTIQLDWRLISNQRLSVYMENPFEDGSGIKKGNGWDGLWGMEFKDSRPGMRPVRGIVVEYLDLTDQSGPMHWEPNDYIGLDGHVADHATGNDNYYNNYFYNGFAHYGMAMGSPLAQSPIYNQDGYLNFADNRVRAWHLGVSGDLGTAGGSSSHWDYRLLATYREGWGTYFIPLERMHHSLDLLVQCGWQMGAWRCSTAFGLSQGNVYGDCTTFNFKIGYHGKLL